MHASEWPKLLILRYLLLTSMLEKVGQISLLRYLMLTSNSGGGRFRLIRFLGRRELRLHEHGQILQLLLVQTI